MKRMTWNACVLLAAAGAAAMAGGCNPEGLVANPTYKAWAGFEPGASATLECTRKSAGVSRQVRITQRLVEKTPDRVVLERSVQVMADGPAKEPVVTKKEERARIEPEDNPRTRPEGKTKELGGEEITVKGRPLPCRISEVQIHVEYGEPIPSKEDLVLRTSVNPEVPGGTVRLYLMRKSSTHDLELTGVLVDFQALKGSGK